MGKRQNKLNTNEQDTIWSREIKKEREKIMHEGFCMKERRKNGKRHTTTGKEILRKVRERKKVAKRSH